MVDKIWLSVLPLHGRKLITFNLAYDIGSACFHSCKLTGECILNGWLLYEEVDQSSLCVDAQVTWLLDVKLQTTEHPKGYTKFYTCTPNS